QAEDGIRDKLVTGVQTCALPISAWQGLFQHGRLQAGQRVLAHGAAGAVGSMVAQLARLAGAYVIGTGRAADREKALDFGAQEFRSEERRVGKECRARGARGEWEK